LLEVKGLHKTYGESVAIRELSFRVESGEFACILGPSGCGKTTLLKCLSGLIPPTSGEVLLHGKQVTGPPPEMALVFQEYGRSLFPWMSVRQNVTFPLRRKGNDRAQQRRLTNDSLSAVGLKDFGEHYPWQLSGGMQQRVAIARALAYQPEILLMDEPFASVDAQTRSDLEDLLLRVWQEFGVTVLFVTHDIDESIYLADRILVLGPRPTEVRESLRIDLARPRDQVATKGLPEFGVLRAHVHGLIRRPTGGAVAG
jgi:NitT/TauT family transport system ATP-binding protein